MVTMSLGRMLWGRLKGHQANRRALQRTAQIAVLSQTENLEPRLLMTADPDDQIQDAIRLGTITTPVTRNDSVNVAIDVDMYRVDVTAGTRLSFDIDRPSTSRLDSLIRLFNASGQELAFNDDAAAPGEVRGLDSFLEYTFATAGSYYLGVSGFGNRNYNAITGLGDTNGTTGSYALVVTNTTPPDLDDQISEAINLGEIDRTVTRTGAIDAPTDVDMYRITVNTARRVEIEIDRPSGSSLDSYLRVFDANGNEVARNDDGPTPGEANSLESFLALNLNAGTYFIAVSGFGNSGFNPLTGTGDTSGSTGNYSLSVTPDTDDQIYQAIDLGEIDRTVTRTGTIDVPTDVDMYRITVNTARRVEIEIDRPSGNLDSYLRVFDANGNEVARNDDGPTPGEGSSVESFLALNLNAGTYFIAVSGFGNSSFNALTGDGDTAGSTGNYSLSVTPDVDDQTYQAIDLGAISGTVTRTESIDVGSDVDMYRFTVATAGRVQIDIDRPSGSLDSYLRVFDANGNEVARNDDGPTPGEADSFESYLDLNLSAGTYFIGISGFGNSSYNALTGDGDTFGSIGNYSLNVTLVATANSDPDDQISEAIDLGVLSGTVSRTGAIDVGTDVDMYRFTLTTAGRVQIDIDRPSGNLDSYLRVFDANGNEVARNDDGPTPGEAGSLESYLDLNLSAGTYFIGISGFGNSSYNAVSGGGDLTGSTGQFSLEVSLANVDPPPPPPPPGSGNRILYLNFDGANISRTDLVRWAGNDWADSVNEFDSDQNGINVQAFLSSRGDREQIISQMLTMIQIDLNPFGITVVRSTAAVVENEGATTIFLGRSTLSNGYYHVADDIDFGNDNRTDIAFVGDEDWGTASNTAIAMSDVALHEAGHTFGLYHVQSGTAPESMGLRYSTPQSQWVTDTRFVDQAFNELPGHGGGRGPQNSYQTMLRTFPANGSSPSGNNGANPLTAQEVRNILRAGYGEGPHNLPIQEGFAPDGAYDDHDHHVQVAGRSEAITVANRQDATRLSAEIAADSVGSVATANQAERVALIASSQTGESATQLNTHDVDDHVTSSNHAEFANQFQSAAWNSLLEGLQSLA